MMNRIATIILNRNLPEPTNKLVEHLKKFDGDMTDVYVLEAGSDENKLCRYYTWYANSKDIKETGLRYSRGMNYALCELWKSGKFLKYDAFFLLTNDTELWKQPTIQPLWDIMDNHSKMGILSPCSKRWGERFLLEEQNVKYFWFIHNNAYLLRRQFIEALCETEEPNYMNFLFDGYNFRGYLSESELIAKAYANDWAAAITSEVFVEENESYLLQHSDIIKTEPYKENLQLYIKEGLQWIKKKYGFNNRWVMQQYVRMFYESYFNNYPEYTKYKI